MAESTTNIAHIGDPAFFTIGNNEEIEALDTDTGTWREAKTKEVYPKTNADGQIQKYDVSVVYNNFSGPKAKRTILVNLRHKNWPIRKCTAPKELPKSRSRNILRYDPKTKIVGDTVYTRCGETVTCWNVQLNDPMNSCMALTERNSVAEHALLSWEEAMCLKTTQYSSLTNPPEIPLSQPRQPRPSTVVQHSSTIQQPTTSTIQQPTTSTIQQPTTSTTPASTTSIENLQMDIDTPSEVHHVQQATSWVSLI